MVIGVPFVFSDRPTGEAGRHSRYKKKCGDSYKGIEMAQMEKDPAQTQIAVRGTWEMPDLLQPHITRGIRAGEPMEIGGVTIQYLTPQNILSIWDTDQLIDLRMHADSAGRINTITAGSTIINPDGKAVSLDRVQDRGILAYSVVELERRGILAKGTTERLGIGKEEIEAARGILQERKKLMAEFNRINTSDISDLPPAGQYKGVKTKVVHMGTDAFIQPQGEMDGLFTYGATTCSILIAVAHHEFNGRITNIGMKHVTDVDNRTSIGEFYDELMGGRTGSITIHVIGGDRELALRVLDASQRRGVKIEFFDAAIRDSSAIVDRNGNVYYGFRQDLMPEAARQ